MRSGALTAAAVGGGLAARYVRGRNRVESSALPELDRRLSDLGTVDALTILPLVERLVSSPDLRGEPGVSYLLRAGRSTVLFDCGLAYGRGPAPLEVNADALGESAADLDALVISHMHVDHVGGLHAIRRHSFAVPRALDLPAHVPAFVPTEMNHPLADVRIVEHPIVVAPGVAVLPPLGRMLFWLGQIAEQALVVNVRDFGIVLITGCGHPLIESTLAAAERVLDVPVRAVVGGLHLPVHPWGTRLLPQALLGNPHWPWQPISEADADEVITAIRERGPRLVALSGHDSTPWAYDAFERTFGARYRTLRVGEPITIDARTGI